MRSGARSAAPEDGVAAEAVADEDGVVELLGLEHGDKVLDERAEGDRGVEEVGAVAEAGLGRGMDGVAGGAEEGCDAGPAPGAVKGAVEQDEGGHSGWTLSSMTGSRVRGWSRSARRRARSGFACPVACPVAHSS